LQSVRKAEHGWYRHSADAAALVALSGIGHGWPRGSRLPVSVSGDW
jgi:hypothetical protein